MSVDRGQSNEDAVGRAFATVQGADTGAIRAVPMTLGGRKGPGRRPPCSLPDDGAILNVTVEAYCSQIPESSRFNALA